MIENKGENPSRPMGSQSDRTGVGCGYQLIQGLSFIWIIGNIALFNFATWLIEQAKFYTGRPEADPRWGMALFVGLSLFVPFMLASLLAKDAKLKRQFLLWSIVSLFLIFFAPLRLFDLTQSQTLLASQCGIFFFALAILFVVRSIVKERTEVPAWSSHAIPYAFIVSGILAIPWVLWGAWGYFLDLVLGVLTGTLAGWFFVILVDLVFFRYQPQKVGSNAYTAILGLVILLAAVGQNGNQWVLLGGAALSGWIMAELYAMRGKDPARANIPAMLISLSLSITYPLIFLDPDEMQSVIASGAGELFHWVNLLITLSLLLLILTGVLGRVANRFELPKKVSGLALLLSAVAIWLLVTALYVFVGQPGFHGEKLFVILSDQADLAQGASISDYDARRQYVYDTLTAHADSSQAGLRERLDRFGLEYTPYYLVNAVEVRGGPLVRLWLSRRPEVARIIDSPYLRPLPAPLPVSSGELSALNDTPWNLKMINADDAWQLGYRGAGIVIGQSDSGVQGDHPELADAYLGVDGEDDYHWFDPWYETVSPMDIGGHGTHTLGTILGDHTGVAPDAGWIGCVNLARNLGNPAYYLDCMQFMLAPFPQDGDPLHDGEPDRGAHILNNSWGCPSVEGCDPSALQPAVTALRAAGIFVVASAGNNGDNGCGTVEDPIAIYDDVFTVGAIDQGGDLTGFSSLGPVEVDGSGRIKPDIVAPGANIPSAFPGGTYAFLSGTSMAGPHVAGVVALMWSANPHLIGDIDLTETILRNSATTYDGWIPECLSGGDPRNAYGSGIVDAYQAVKNALEIQ